MRDREPCRPEPAFAFIDSTMQPVILQAIIKIAILSAKWGRSSVELDSDFKISWPIRQGDVFGFWDWRNRPPLSRFGVIITADCDIENGQQDQELVYLRIVSQSDYVDVFWSRSKLVAAREQALRDLIPQLNRLRRESDAEAENLSYSDVPSWITNNTPDVITDSIKITDERERAKLLASLTRTKSAAVLATTPLGSSCLDHLLQLKNQQRQAALTQAANELRSDRDEIFFVSSLKDHQDASGYYVLLDQIGAIRRDQLTDSIDSVRRGEKAAYRFGTLSKTYKYAVAQRFAFLFQKIGLPNEHKERLNSALGRIKASKAQFGGSQNGGSVSF